MQSRLAFSKAIWSTLVSDMIDKVLSQIRGEITHEFSVIEYYVRSALAHFLTSQPKRTCKKYREQFDRFRTFVAQRPIEWNPKILRNPDVQWMAAELMAAAESAFGNCLDRLVPAAEKANYSKISKLLTLVAELKAATDQRNLLTHSIWIDEQGKIVMQNFPDYHERKWMFIDKYGKRLTRKPSPKWTLQELQDFNVHLHDLSERLRKLFHNQE